MARGPQQGPEALRAALEDRAPANGPAPAAEAPRVLVEYGDLSGTRWIPNGPAFGPGPGSEGAIALALADEGLVVDSVATRPAAISHGLWSELAVHADSATSRGGSLNWVQAGRTLASPSFLVRTGRVAHLVRGEGKLITPISSHKMVAGPLHGASIRRFDTGGRWEWIVQDMPSAKGWYAHAEWSATGPSSLQVARTIELEGGAPAPALGGWESEDLEEDGPGARLAALLRDAAELLERGGVEGRILGDEERAALLEVAEFASRRVQAVRTRLATELSAEEAAFAALVARRQLTSRLAPAALDLEGRDEVVLDRGSYGSPGAPAPRAAPRVLLATNAGPDAVDGGERAPAPRTLAPRLGLPARAARLGQPPLAGDVRQGDRRYPGRLRRHGSRPDPPRPARPPRDLLRGGRLVHQADAAAHGPHRRLRPHDGAHGERARARPEGRTSSPTRARGASTPRRSATRCSPSAAS